MEKNDPVFCTIGDLCLGIRGNMLFAREDSNMKSFFTPTPNEPVFYFDCVPTESIPQKTGQLRLVASDEAYHDLLNENGMFFRGFFCSIGVYDVVTELRETQGLIYYLSEELLADRLKGGYSFINYCCLELLFLRRGGLFLHSSHLNVNGRALLFSAPSGTGKSTQADLWHEVTGAEIINGDRSLLRKKDGVWHAYGCPMCGTSGIHKQGDEPIHAIVMLGQGKENALRRLGAAEAFSLLYPQVTIPKWSRELVLRGMELLDSVIAEVPVYQYSCTKTEDAVATLREALGL